MSFRGGTPLTTTSLAAPTRSVMLQPCNVMRRYNKQAVSVSEGPGWSVVQQECPLGLRRMSEGPRYASGIPWGLSPAAKILFYNSHRASEASVTDPFGYFSGQGKVIRNEAYANIRSGYRQTLHRSAKTKGM